MPLFSDKKKSANSLRTNRPLNDKQSSAQQSPRKEVLKIIDKMIKEHKADLDYLKDK